MSENSKIERIPNPMTPYLQCGRVLGVLRDGRMVLCQLPLGHKSNECMNFEFEEVDDYTLIEEFEDFGESGQRKATA